MKVREIMGSHVRQISASAMLSEAADRMRAAHANALPVVENKQIVGVVTNRDIAVKAVLMGLNPRTTPIGYVMTRKVACCSQEEDVEEAARIMKDHQVHRLIVLDTSSQAVGILSVGDLALKTVDEPAAGGTRGRSHEPIAGG